MKKYILAAIAATLLCVSAHAQDFNQSYNFPGAQIGGPGTSTNFTNTGITSFVLQWNPGGSLSTCSVRVDSSSDGSSWGTGDVIGAQTCTSAGSISGTFSKAFVRVNVTTLSGAGLNVTLKGYAGGSSSSASPQAPAMAFYLSNACATGTLGTNGQCFNTTADVQQFNDGSWTNVSTTITFNSTHFGAGQAIVNPVGMSIMGFQTCADDVTSAHASGGEIAPNAAMPTVTGFTGTTLTISATPVNTQALHATFPQGGCVVMGHIDDTAAVSLWAALNAAPQCPKVFLAASNYLFTKPPEFMWDNPLACQNIGPALGGPAGNPGFGSTTLPAGYEVEGRSVGATGIYLATNFPNGDACNHKPTPAGGLAPFQNGGACFVIPVMGGWRDLRIDGGGQGAPTALNGKTLGPYMAVAKLVDFTCVNYGTYTGGNSTGIELSFNNWLQRVNSSGCGAIGIVVDNGASNNVGEQVVVESSSIDALLINGATANNNIAYSFACHWCTFAAANSQPLGAFSVISNFGGSVFLNAGYIYPNNGNEGANTNNGGIGYQNGTAGGVLIAQGTKFSFATGGASNTQTAIKLTAAGTVSLINSQLGSQSSGFDYQDVAGSVLQDLGGNVFTPRFSLAGTVIADGHSLRATCTGVGTAASTLGLYGTGPNVTATTCTSATIGSGIPLTQARTVSTLRVSATAAGTNASSGVVTVLKNAVATTITCTIGTATSCNDFTHSVAFAAGDLISIQFTTQAADTLAGVQAFVMWQ